MEMNPMQRWRDHVATLPKYGKSKGLGDTIAKITTTLGVKPCGGCKKRQEALNKSFPYNK